MPCPLWNYLRASCDSQVHRVLTPFWLNKICSLSCWKDLNQLNEKFDHISLYFRDTFDLPVQIVWSRFDFYGTGIISFMFPYLSDEINPTLLCFIVIFSIRTDHKLNFSVSYRPSQSCSIFDIVITHLLKKGRTSGKPSLVRTSVSWRFWRRMEVENLTWQERIARFTRCDYRTCHN
jgi:hypothetical protein